MADLSIFYLYDEKTKKYTETRHAQIDPIETEKAGHVVYCRLPKCATYEQPLEPKDGFDVIWCGSAWEYREIPKPEPAPEPTPEEIKQRRIAELKAQLSGTDYKIIKCSECSLAGVDLPYDVVVLHAQRQAIRDEINELEG